MEKAISRSISAIGKIVLTVMLAVGMVNAASFDVKAADDVIHLTQEELEDHYEEYIVKNEVVDSNNIAYKLIEGKNYCLDGDINLDNINLDYTFDGKEVKYKYFLLNNVNLDLNGHELSAKNIYIWIMDSTINYSDNSEGKISAPSYYIEGETYLNNAEIEISSNTTVEYYGDFFIDSYSDSLNINNSSISCYYFQNDGFITMSNVYISCTYFENVNASELEINEGSKIDCTIRFRNYGSVTMSGGVIKCSDTFINFNQDYHTTPPHLGTIKVTGGSVIVDGEMTNSGVFQVTGGSVNVSGDISNTLYGTFQVISGSVNVNGKITNDGIFQYAVWLSVPDGVKAYIDGSLVEDEYTLIDLGETYKVTLIPDSEFSLEGKNCLALNVEGSDYERSTDDNGNTVLTCESIESVVRIEAIANDEHTLEHIDVKEANCTEVGNIEYWQCSACLKCFNDEKAEAEDEIALEDTVIPINPDNHDYVEEVTTSPTCTEKGETTYTCSHCGESYTETMVALGHSLEYIGKASPDCTTDGNTEYWYCTRCEKYFADEDATEEISKEDTVIKATGHSYVSKETKAPTCTEKGETTYICSICNDSYIEEIEALGHDYDYDNAFYAWTETDEGWECIAVALCKNDNNHYDTLTCTVKSEITTDPACLEEGEATYTASFKAGDKTYTCSETKTKAVAATGHSWAESDSETYGTDKEEITITFVCEDCGEIREEKLVIETVSRDINAHSTLKWSDLISTDDIVELFESGAEIDLDLSISKYNAPKKDVELIENKVDALFDNVEYTISYLNIDINMYIEHADGSEEVRNFTDTLKPVTITVELPEELQDAEGNSYTVIRIHDGEAEAIDCSEEDNMISFTSDKFSTYAIVKINEVENIEVAYNDENNEIENVGNDLSETEEVEETDSVKTSDNTNMFIYAAGLALSLAGIVLYERKRRYNN